METGSELIDLLFRVESALIMLSASGAIMIFKTVFPKLTEGGLWRRLSRLLPIVLCMGLIWIPGLAPENAELGVFLTLGFVLGTMSGWFFDLFKKTIMGKTPSILTGGDK